MTVNTVSLRLELDSQPAPGPLMQALQEVRVRRTDCAPSTFALTFHTERIAGNNDFLWMRDRLLASFIQVTMTVTVAGQPKVLMDGFITQRQLSPAGDPIGTRLTVSGEDVSVRMNMFQLSLPYPRSVDYAVVNLVLVKYLPYKIRPDVKMTVASFVPNEISMIENGTDRDFLLQLAAKHGYRFYIEPSGGWNTAYWGPPKYHGQPQKSLIADGGPGCNVEHVELSDNALAPTITYGAVSQNRVPILPETVPVLAAASTRDPLSTDPGMGSYKDLLTGMLTDPLEAVKKLVELQVRGTLLQPQNQGDRQSQMPIPAEAYTIAEGQTNESTDRVAVVRGRLSTTRYGEVLNAPGIVPVRGVGHSFDGLYYLSEVTHAIDTTPGGFDYTQDFTLTRGGVGSTLQEVSS